MSGAIAEPPAANHWHIRLVDGEPERADCVNPDCPMNGPPPPPGDPYTDHTSLLRAGDVVCDEYDHTADEPCMELSRFHVTRSDRDDSFGPAEACEAHLADAVAGMVNGDTDVCAVVNIRWDERR